MSADAIFPVVHDYHAGLGIRRGDYAEITKAGDGGPAAFEEAILMVSEKVDAAIIAGVTILSGGTIAAVIRDYRRRVAVNAGRLRHAGQQPRIRLPLKLVVRN